MNETIGKSVDEIDTPALIVDEDLLKANIKDLLQRLSKFAGVSVRPHLKTGKCPEIAQLLLQAGAKGICVAKLSEAEVYVDAGISDILITTEIAGMPKLERFLRLQSKCPNLKIVVDSIAPARELNALAAQLDIKEPIKVLIDVNVGQNRTGVSTAEEALTLAQAIAAMTHFQLLGVQGYEGHAQQLPEADREVQCREAMVKLNSVVQLLRSKGHAVPIVTTGGTGTAEICASCENITEVQPGSFVFMDVSYRQATNGKYANALSVLSTVISKPSADRVVIDAGLKSLSTDMGYAELRDLPQLAYKPGGDEHGILTGAQAEITLSVGQKIHLLPSHIDTTVALFDDYFISREGKILDV